MKLYRASFIKYFLAMQRVFLISILTLLTPLLFLKEAVNSFEAQQNFIKFILISMLMILALLLLFKKLNSGIKTKKASKLQNLLYAGSTVFLVVVTSICIQLARIQTQETPGTPALILLVSSILGLAAFQYFKNRSEKLFVQALAFLFFLFNLTFYSLLQNYQDINIIPAFILSLALAPLYTAYYFSGILMKADYNKLSNLDNRLLGLLSSAGLSIFLLLVVLRFLPASYFAVFPLFYFAFKLAPHKNDNNFSLLKSCKVQDRIFYAFIAIITGLRISLSYF